MSAVVHARVIEQLTRLRLRYVAERLDAVLGDAARSEPTYLDFLDSVLRERRSVLELPRVFPEPSIAFESLSGEVGWERKSASAVAVRSTSRRRT